MNSTTKLASNLSHENTLRSAHNEVTATLGVSGFVTGKIGHKITQTVTATNTADDTLVFTYTDSGTQLMVLTVVYTDGTRETLLSVERTA